ncbi:MAG TPA: DinB family protein [Terriglobia bacterium]|nr:DinB family protein [Terriglobia bacterium]
MTDQTKLQEGIVRIQEQRGRIIGVLQTLTQAQADFQPAAGAWSIGQIGQHLALVERGLMEIVRDMFDRSGPRQVLKVEYDRLPLTLKGVPRGVARFGFQMIRPFSFLARFTPQALISFVIANPIVKATAAPQTEPAPGKKTAEVLTLLSEVRQETLRLLERAKERELSQYHWLHPVLGYQDLYGTLELIASHDQRHLQQIERVRKDARFPAA